MSLTGNFDKLNKGNGGQRTVPPDLSMDERENYATPSQVRNLCFVQPDGKRLFLNYAYLVSGEYSPETNTIVLTYTSHIVTLKGYNMNDLYLDTMYQLTKLIFCKDVRYVAIEKDCKPFVSELTISKIST